MSPSFPSISFSPSDDSPGGEVRMEPAIVEEDAGHENQHANRAAVAAASGKGGPHPAPGLGQGPATDAEVETWGTPQQPVSASLPSRAATMHACVGRRNDACVCRCVFVCV